VYKPHTQGYEKLKKRICNIFDVEGLMLLNYEELVEIHEKIKYS
jgi:hypothetical protein